MDTSNVSVEPVAGHHRLCVDHYFVQPPETVWNALTDSGRMAEWLAPGEIELKRGGRVHLQFAGSGTVVESVVAEIEPEKLLAYDWVTQEGNAGPVRWELSRENSGTRLVLTHLLPASGSPARTLAGWHTHFELLEAALNGQPAAWPQDRFRALRDHYLGVAGS